MHGVIISNLKKYVEEKLGEDAWDTLRDKAGLPGKAFIPISIYPDSDLEDLLVAAVEVTGQGRDEILKDFGAWVIPPLMKMYRSFIPEDWDAVTFLKNIDDRIHERVVRMKDANAKPPHINVSEISPGLLEVEYQSHRDMSYLALGCVYGVAEYYGQKAALMEEKRVVGTHRTFIMRISAGEQTQRDAV
ncbi:MAG: heme NO-binding domain-containing protein [Alcanivorax jadensis]|uniref:heme NO-binding domain-containing protein n=1 Tax=Alcanivorax jadensis TaxID=64988 RepID=UPI003001F871